MSLMLSGCGALSEHFGGNFEGSPGEMAHNIGPAEKSLIQAAFTFPAGKQKVVLTDHHVHAIMKEAPSYLHPDYYATWGDPLRRLFFTPIFMSASGVTDIHNLDEQYEARLLELLQHVQATQRQYAKISVESQYYIYALDYYHDDHGRIDKSRTDLHVANETVIDMAKRLNDALYAGNQGGQKVVVVPVASVHPARGDFDATVKALAQKGVRHFKWLPQIMNIDMSKVDPARYQVLANNKITLLVHTGDEHALRVEPDLQTLGDPMLLRHALDQGVHVVALHAGREGHAPDGERHFDRFIRLMEMEEYDEQLCGEISAITIPERMMVKGSIDLIKPLREWAEEKSMWGRLVNGSDYPLIAIAYLQSMPALVSEGLLSGEEARAMDTIYGYNPLLFDFVLKRKLFPKMPF